MNVQTSPSSPDFSPASVSSALLTPTDLSPGRSFDVKLHSPYEHPYLSPPSLLFENGSPGKDQETIRVPLVHLNHTRNQPGANAYPLFEPFAEPPTPAPVAQNQNHLSPPSGLPQSLYSSTLPRRAIDEARLHPVDWRLNNQLQQQQPLHPDWRLAEKITNDYAFGNGREEPLRSSFVYQQSPSTQFLQSSHEVSICLNTSNVCSCMRHISQLIFCPCFILRHLHHIMLSLHGLSNHLTNRRLSFSSRNSRLLTLTREPR